MRRLTIPSNMQLLSRNDLVKIFAFGKVIDVGCAEGYVFGSNAVNVDIYRCKPDIPNFVLADANHLPFKDLAFDCCVMGELLEHVESPERILEEAQRVASIIILSVPNEHEWHSRLNPFDNPGHIRHYTQTTFIHEVQRAGIVLIQFVKVNLVGWSHFIAMGISKNSKKYDVGE